MASVLFKTFVFAGMIAWTRLGWHYRAFVLLAFLFPSAKDPKNDVPKEVPHKLAADSSERAIRRAVPRGTPLSDARKVMERKGFKCRLVTDTDGRQWLDCRIWDWEPGAFLVSRVRRVRLHAEEGKVIGVGFQEYLSGL
jgi:hypothetical protein